jgi:hypothetical protein
VPSSSRVRPTDRDLKSGTAREYARPTDRDVDPEAARGYARPTDSDLKSGTARGYARPTDSDLKSGTAREYARPTDRDVDPEAARGYARPAEGRAPTLPQRELGSVGRARRPGRADPELTSLLVGRAYPRAVLGKDSRTHHGPREEPRGHNEQAKREGRVAGPMNLISWVTAL